MDGKGVGFWRNADNATDGWIMAQELGVVQMDSYFWRGV